MRASGEQLTPPLSETMAHVRDRAWLGAVLRERGIRDLRQCPECVGKQQPVKP